MSSFEAEIDGGDIAASRIAADPAFSALDASGAPIVAASGDPLKIVFLNAAARAVFGADKEALAARLFFSDEPGARRLAELVESVRHGAALRLERLRFELADAPQTITILCRKLIERDGPACFVIAALGVRPASLSAPEREGRREAEIARIAPPADAPAPFDPMAATEALRARLAERHGARAARFLWKTDAAGRFTDATHVLADVVGEANADILGREVAFVAAALGLDPAFAQAIASQKSWKGVSAAWPLADEGARVPVTLGALPTMDADRRFAGFQGYGVIHLDRAAYAAPPALTEAPPPALAPAAPERFAAANVVPLRPPPQQRQEAASSEDEVSAEPLTSAEKLNFEEIARALRAGGVTNGGASSAASDSVREEAVAAAPEQIEPGMGSAERPETEEVPAAASLDDVAAQLGALAGAGAAEERPPLSLATTAPLAPAAFLPAAAAGLLDRLPVGLLIARGAQTLFANRTLLDYLGYDDLAGFEADGGLARMFFGRPLSDPGARAAAVQASGGEALDVDVHLQTVDWEGAPATLVTLRRNRNRPPGPEESALALARERDEKLARVRADNSLLRAILETSGVAVALIDDNRRIESATGAFAALFDAEKGAFDGLPFSSLFALEDERAFAARLGRAAETGEALRLDARIGGRPYEATLRRLGPAQKLCVSLRAPDADERHDELAAARDAAEQANAAKSDFLARISHEIRTPLNAIIGFAEVMMEERFGPIGSERYKDYLKDVHSSGAHVLSLVNDLLDLSKIEAGKMELEFDRVDANAVIAECASIMQTQANQAKVVMRLALADRLPPIRADQRSLKQILLNLLSNAMKFSEPGGQVIVSSALTDAGYVVIRVKDTGIGMSEDEVATALEPFKQVATSRSVRGTGLGLPLTKALIEANHASFTIRSRKNEGTLIEIAFPPPQVLAAE
ncbi:PAS domain-containing sensor histidine kinase [Methylocystis parvus]|uniref:histidine kinase n=1 Tax=Methylocystis parvus TaxID=134 RepID=A0A6B8M749_9HYPH|nr:PAS domain-containing sensor histidine kinase [Methylocystis parvus]QGM96640.1 PAS domain-containing protein [Methylocystis parvus]WBJ99503.1 PAS domain-containing sensor histidine kinase [Methylocystis parvus OBBP]